MMGQAQSLRCLDPAMIQMQNNTHLPKRDEATSFTDLKLFPNLRFKKKYSKNIISIAYCQCKLYYFYCSIIIIIIIIYMFINIIICIIIIM